MFLKVRGKRFGARRTAVGFIAIKKEFIVLVYGGTTIPPGYTSVYTYAALIKFIEWPSADLPRDKFTFKFLWGTAGRPN